MDFRVRAKLEIFNDPKQDQLDEVPRLRQPSLGMTGWERALRADVRILTSRPQGTRPKASDGSTVGKSAVWRTARLVGLPLLVFVIFLANGYSPLIRFDSTIANWLSGAMFLCSVVVALGFATYVPQRVLSRTLIALALSPIICICVIASLIDLLMGPDVRTTCIRTGGYELRTYTNRGCGFYGDPSVTVQQDKLFLPGILLVRQLADFEQADSATCTRSGPNTFVLQVSDVNLDPEDVPQRKIVKLKPYMYF